MEAVAICPPQSHHASELRRLTSLAFNVHFEHVIVYSVMCFILPVNVPMGVT